MSSVIKKPTKFLIPGVTYGEECCIHNMSDDLYLISLNFDEKGRDIVDIEKNCEPALRSKINNNLNPILEIIAEDIDPLTKQSYLFIGNDKILYLVSCSYDGQTFNYRAVQERAKDFNLETPKIVWKGIYTRQVEIVFFTDIIVQKY